MYAYNNRIHRLDIFVGSSFLYYYFQNYGKKDVMRLALPVSVKFLHKGNKDLSRNMSSYLSLAAIENAELLAQHIQPIIDSVISGNYSLARVLPQIYSVNRDPIKSHVMTLVSILPNCDNNEKLALLTVFSYVAKENPAVSRNRYSTVVKYPLQTFPTYYLFYIGTSLFTSLSVTAVVKFILCSCTIGLIHIIEHEQKIAKTDSQKKSLLFSSYV